MRHLVILLIGALLATAEEAKLYIQLGHSAAVTCLAFSRDGKWLLTGSSDSTARLWEVATGREIRVFTGHTGSIKSVAIAPDNLSVMTAGSDGKARIWDLEAGREKRQIALSGNGTATFFPDGQSVLTAGQTVSRWDVPSGREIRRFEGSGVSVVSPDGRLVLVSQTDETARLLDSNSGREIGRLVGHSVPARSVLTGDTFSQMAFSPDGRTVVTAGGFLDHTVRLWDVGTMTEIRRIPIAPADPPTPGTMALVGSVAFSPDGRRLVMTVTSTFQLRFISARVDIWDIATNRLQKSIQSGSANAVFSPDSTFIASVTPGGIPYLWKSETGEEVRRFGAKLSIVNCLTLSRDGSELLMGGSDKVATLWDLTTGRMRSQYRGHAEAVLSVSLSPDGRTVATGAGGDPVRLWDVASGKELQRIGGMGRVTTVAFSPDGKFLVFGGGYPIGSSRSFKEERKVHLWDIAANREVRTFEREDIKPFSAMFSPDGHLVAVTDSHDIVGWEVTSGLPLNRFSHGDGFRALAFSPDSNLLAAGGGSSQLCGLCLIRVRNPLDTVKIAMAPDADSGITSVTFAPDGHSILTTSYNHATRLWSTDSGQKIREFGPSRSIDPDYALFSQTAAFLPDGHFIFTAGLDGTIKLSDVSTGRMLATLATFTNGSWAVIDAEGRYDASDPDQIDSLYWQVGGSKIVNLSQLRRSFYVPGLLAEILQSQPLPAVKGLSQIDHLPPAVNVATDGDSSHPAFQVTLQNTDRDPTGKITVRVNGRPFAVQPTASDKLGIGQTLHFDLEGAQLADGDNTVSVTAASSDNLIESQPVSVTLKQGMAQQGSVPRGVAPVPAVSQPRGICAGKFYGIFIGTAAFPYARNLSLRYPESDARDLSAAIRVGAEALCGKDKVEILTLTSSDPDSSRTPTKDNIRRAFEDVSAKSSRKDLLFVYLSGHGASPSNDSTSYFYLTQDARQVDVDVADKLRTATTVSAAELVQWLTNPNLPDKQVLIIDTCAAGAANSQLAALSSKARSAADDLKKAVDNFNLDTGTYVLMGSATDRASYESDRFQHGLLTYALLRGMKGDALVDGTRLEAAHWFETTIPSVEKYAALIGRDQRPQKAIPKAVGGVPIGFFTEAARASIPVTEPAVAILKLVVCLDEATFTDSLQLASGIRAELRVLGGSAARGPAVAYDDNSTEAATGSLTPQVHYRVDGVELIVTASLVQSDKAIATETLTVPVTDVKDASRKIAEALYKLAIAQSK